MNFFERYQFDRNKDRIGKGGFGEVYRAFDSLLHQNVAVKFYPHEEGQEKYGVIDEMKTAIRLHHVNIVRVFDADIVEIADNFGVKHKYEVGIMELVEGGSLRDFIDSKPSPEHIKSVVMGMMQGLAYLHNHSIIHRDLKPANILIKYENGIPIPKIVDFGISKQASNEFTSRTGIIGTYEYIAPEMLDVETYGVNGKITTNVDMWSFGVMLYEMLTQGELPYGSRRFGMTEGQIIAKILGSTQLAKIETIPQPYKAIITRCLVRNAGARSQSMEDLLRLFEKTETQQPAQKPIQQQPATQVQPQKPISPPKAPSKPQVYREKKPAYNSPFPPKASIGLRFVASMIDGFISFGIFVLTLLMISGDLAKDPDGFASITSAGTMFIYYLFKDGLEGGSLGKRIVGLTVLHQPTQEPIGYGRSFLRNVSSIIPLLNFFTSLADVIMVLADKQGKRIGDNIANTMVVEKSHLR